MFSDGPYNCRWLGHASIEIVTDNTTFLVDPLFTNRYGPFGVFGSDDLYFDMIPEYTQRKNMYVLISHDHYDHLDKKSVQKLSEEGVCFLVPLGLGKQLQKWGISNVTELDWWQQIVVEGSTISCLPANHWSGRIGTRNYKTLWCSWHIRDSQNTSSVYHVGDSGPGKHFDEIHKEMGNVTTAFLPVGAFHPAWLHGDVHLHPVEAVKIGELLGCKHIIPIHWGTFYISSEPPAEPIRIFEESMVKRQLNAYPDYDNL